ncbi:MAG: hypothetical protein IAF08_01790, partial [Rhizobacter sp.]|nr:hypothetical protein [Chlorobiales bacterium]
FCGAYFSNRLTSVVVTLASLWVSDLFINAMYMGGFVPFYEGFYWQYATFALITFIGGVVGRNVKPAMVVGGSLAASMLFFTVSNFGVWTSGLMYPVTPEGLAACYIAAIPFFGGTLAGDLFYSVLLFGGFELMKRKLPALAVAN